MNLAPQPLKTLIVPAEIKAREMDSRILLGVLGAQHGWRVILGSKSPLNRRVWKYGGDIYICQTLTKRRQNNLTLFSNLGLRNIGWDEEGLIYYGRDIYLSRRVSEDSLSLMEGLIAWGDMSAQDLAVKADKTDLEVRALGNPRMDLLRPELRGLFEDAAYKLTEQYGDYILLNTNYPSVNPHETVGNARSKVIEADKNATTEAAQRFTSMQAHRKKTLNAFFEILPEMANKFPDRNIIIRPHPAESLAKWRDACGKHKNLIITQEGSVIPWLMGAKALIHNGCTTAVEYYLLSRSAIAYTPEGVRPDESPLPNGVSHHASDKDKLLTLIAKSINGKLLPAKSHKALMDTHLSAQNGPLASARILSFCDDVLSRQTRHKSGLWSKYTTLLYCALRQIHRSTRMGDPARDYISRVFPQTSLAEVSMRAERIRSLLDLKTPIKVRECARNIFEIEPDL